MSKSKYIKNNGTFYPQDHVLKRFVIPFIPDSVTPNGLTITRFMLTPIVLILLINSNFILGLPLFIIAAFTDMLDGSIARTKDRITAWGIVADPIADKILIGSVALLFLIRYLSVYLAIAVIGMEVLTVGLGIVFKKEGSVVPSNIFGKLKFTLQVLGIFLVIIGAWAQIDVLYTVSIGVFILSILLAMISLGINVLNPVTVKK